MAPLINLVNSGNEVDHRRLPRSVRSDESSNLSLLNVQGNIIDGPQSAKILDQIFYVQEWMAFAIHSFSRPGIAFTPFFDKPETGVPVFSLPNPLRSLVLKIP